VVAVTISPVQTTSQQSRFASGPAIVLYIAGPVLPLQLLIANRYGYFGDEMYHMACGGSIVRGYVDQPPLIAVFAWLTRHLLGGVSVRHSAVSGIRQLRWQSATLLGNTRRARGNGLTK
jgi:hypothetical protein